MIKLLCLSALTARKYNSKLHIPNINIIHSNISTKVMKINHLTNNNSLPTILIEIVKNLTRQGSVQHNQMNKFIQIKQLDLLEELSFNKARIVI